MFSKYTRTIYVFNTRKRDQFFKPTRGKWFARETGREGGRAEKKSGVESVVFVYSTRQKFFSLKDKFQFYYDIIDDFSEYFLRAPLKRSLFITFYSS